LIHLRARRHIPRPGQGSVKRNPTDQGSIEERDVLACHSGAHCEAEGVGQMAYHLMGVHLTPKRTAFGAQALEPIQQILYSGGIERLHAIAYRITFARLDAG
jgi:hypothetical protein